MPTTVLGNTVLGPANTAKKMCIWPPAKCISNTNTFEFEVEAYNPQDQDALQIYKYTNTAKYIYVFGICIWPLALAGQKR